MAALPSSGEISFGDIAGNRGVAESDVDIKTESEQFASGSRVGDIDGDPANLGDADDRTALRVAPYSLSEFHGADYPSSIITGITFTTAGGGGDTDTVDGETLAVAFTTDDTPGTYTVRLLDSGENTDASTTISGAGTVNFTNLTLDDGTGYKAQVEYDQFNKVNDNATFNHHDLIGAISITGPSVPYVAASTTVSIITHARTIANTNALNDYNWTFAKTSGDSSGLRLSGEGSYGSSVSSTASTPAIQYKGPGWFTANLRIDGTPSQARNYSTAAEVSHRIEYSDGISTNDQSTGANEGATITCVATHKGIVAGIKIGYVNASSTSTFLASDTSDSTDSRTVASGNISKGVTAASIGVSTISAQIRAEDKTVSSTYNLSNTFNVYPSVDDEFGADDIAISVDPVLVGSNTILTIVRNITDNIVGYRWSNDGSGTMTSNNLSGGDIDGTSVDGLTPIDEYSSTTTNTVSFDTAQENKTIGLILYGKLSQTSTKRTKTLNVELVDAITLNDISAQNGQGAITVSGNQSGYEDGVTFGLVSASADTTFLSTNSTSDTTDSRYTLDAYTGAFTPDNPYGNTATQHIQARVIDKEDGTTAQNKNTATRIVYPTLTTSKNTINASRNTIYSDVQASDTSTYPPTVSYGTPGTPTDQVTGYLYSAGTSLTEHGFSAASSATTTYGGGSGIGSSVTSLRIQGTGASGTQETTTTHTVTVNYEPRIYDITFTGGTIITETTDLKIQSIVWQGFDSAGFIARVYTSSGGGGSEVGENEPAINDLGGITFEDNCLDNDTGGTQKTSTTWIHATAANIGVVSHVGTVYLRVVDAGGSYAYEESLVITDYNSVSLGGYTLESTNAGFDTQEDAAVPNIPVGANPYAVTGYYLGTLGSGTVTILSSKGGSGFSGGNKWWDFPGGYIGYIDNSGNLAAANYITDGNAQPKAPDQLGLAAQTNATQINITWRDNSAIEDGYLIYQSTSGTATNSDPEIADLSPSTTSFNKTGLSAGVTHYYAIYADNGTGRSTVLQGYQQTQLVDATTVNITSAQNGQAAITVSGNQSGLSGGVTFGLVSSSAATSFLSTNSTSDTTDSRYTLDAYTGAFTPDGTYGDTTTQYIKGRVIDRSDGTSGQNRNTGEIIVYPTLTTSKNTIAGNISTIYSNVRADDTSTYPPTVSYGTPGTPTDNVSSYLYSAGTSLTEHVFSDDDAATTTYGGGSGVGSSTTSLRIRGTGASGTQETTTTHAVTVNYEPRIYNVTTNEEGGTTILINTTDLILKNIFWQGFTSAGFTVSVYTSTGGNGTEISEGPFTINDVGGTYAYNENVNNTGGAQITTSEWSDTTLCNMGVISQAGTVYMRVVDAGGSIAYDEAITVVTYSDVQLTGYQFEGTPSGFSDAENAHQVTLPAGTSVYNVTVYYIGTPGSTDPLIILDTQSPTDYFAGGNLWWDFSGLGITGYVGKISNLGALTVANYYSDANAPPKPPTGVSAGSGTTSTITLNWTNQSAIDEEIWIYYVKNGSNSADSSNISWEDNGLSASLTTDIITGLEEDSPYSFVVYAKRGNSLSEVGSGNRATASTTAASTAEWSSVFSNISMNGNALQTLTSNLVSATLSDEDGDTTLVISGTGSHQFRWGLASNESDASSYGGSHTINPSGNNWTIYMRFQTTLSKFGATQTNTWTATNLGGPTAVSRTIISASI